MNLNLSVGDIVLTGRFKNKRTKIKSLGADEIGQPTYNKDRKLLSVRIEKNLPEGMWSSRTLAEKYKEKDMDKKAFLEEMYNSAFEDELEKISGAEKALGFIGRKVDDIAKSVKVPDKLKREFYSRINAPKFHLNPAKEMFKRHNYKEGVKATGRAVRSAITGYVT